MPEVNFNLDFISAIILFGVFQSALLVFIFLKNKSQNSNLYLSLFLLVLMTTQIESFLNKSGFMYYVLFLLNTSAPFVLLFGPLLYMYTKSELKLNSDVKWQLIHISPFILYFFYSFFFFLQPIEIKYNAFVTSFHPYLPYIKAMSYFPKDPLNIQGFIIVEGICLQLFIYSVFSFKVIYDNKNQNTINKEVKSWLIYLNGILLVSAILLFLSEGGVINGVVFFKTILPDYFDDIFGTLCSYFIVFYILKNNTFFKRKTIKYQKSLLPENLRKKKLDKIHSLLNDEKLYKENSFSLKLLSQRVGISTNHISQVINQELNMNFNDLINSYRIEEAKQILSGDSENIKIEQLAYDLGYKSKSAFFNAFKKLTSTTPSQYRKMHIKV